MQPPNANPQLLPNGFSYQSRVLSAQKSLDLFYYLQQNLNWQQPNITVFGKTGPIPRLQCFISEENLEYGYSGHKLDLEPWPDVLLAMRTRLENMQQEARLIDFLQEDLTSFSDEEVGAAARVIHTGGQKVLNDYVTLAHVRNEDEETRITVEEGFNPQEIRLTGNVTGSAPFQGTLVHKGWKATSMNLPKLAENYDASVIAPAEVEL